MKVAVVTGASAGLGAEFVKQIDARFDVDEIWLVARRSDLLEELARGLKRARGVTIAADLSEREGAAALAGRLAAEKPDLKILVNNAGFGMFGRFEKLEKARQLEMIDLNVRALTEITYDALKYMGEGAIVIQVASMVGMFPAPGWSVYAATKAYVVNFSCGLAGELKNRKITCTACCPGMMKTDFWIVSSEKFKTRRFSMDGADPSEVAAKALAHARRGKLVSIKGLSMRLFGIIAGAAPRKLFVYIMQKLLQRDESRG